MAPSRERRAARVGWLLVVLAALAVDAAASWFLSLRPTLKGTDLDHHLTFRLALAFSGLASLLVAAGSCRCLTGRFWTTWWDPSTDRPDGPLGWAEVLGMAAGGPGSDALSRPKLFRRKHFARLAAANALALASAGMAAVTAADGLLAWRLPEMVWEGKDDPAALAAAVANASGNLTAYLALLAAAVSIVFTYHQLRAKVRADNRQAWIDRARRLIAEVVKDAEKAGSPAGAAIQRRIELELMLNPSEKDHRLLIYLVQRLARVPDADSIRDANHLREEAMAELTGRDRCALLAILDETREGELVGHVVRLSHVLLKREWERVKHTR